MKNFCEPFRPKKPNELVRSLELINNMDFNLNLCYFIFNFGTFLKYIE